MSSADRTSTPLLPPFLPPRSPTSRLCLYSGEPEQAGEFTWWGAGTWRVNSPGQLALSVANDEVITYRYTLTDDVLKITDPQGCTVAYRRSG